MMGRILIVAIAVGSPAILVACGGGGPEPPACADSEVQATGDPAGGELATRFTVTQYIFVNATSGSTGYLEINRGDSAGELTMDWDELVANGDTVPARGQLIAGTGYGNCVSGPLDSELTMDADGEGGSFRLRNLRAGPPFCGEEVSGEIAGCFRSPP